MSSSSFRKSPVESATLFDVGDRKTGLDGNKWEIVETKSGVKRWQKIQSPSSSLSSNAVPFTSSSKKSRPLKSKRYYIHDNGGRPFLVKISGSDVSIYRIPKTSKNSDNTKEENYSKLLLQFHQPQKIWIGQDFSRDKFFEGNSILLQINAHTYIYIGSEIYQFELAEAQEKVKSYTSPVGNSDVPYPYLVTNKNIYFMIEDVYAPINQFEEDDIYFNEPYEVHYAREGKDKNYVTHKIKHRKVLVKRLW